MSKDEKKTRVAFTSLTSDEGCWFSILELGEKLFSILKKIDVAEFRLIREEPKKCPKEGFCYDIAFVEGSVITKEDLNKLKSFRKMSRLLVAVGACAVSRGIPGLKNYVGNKTAIDRVYREQDGIDNPEIKSLREYVQVDYEIPGCPVDAKDFLRVLYSLNNGIIPEQNNFPVCYECQLAENECLLLEGKKCLGPITRGGCRAICPANKVPCNGCRGLLPNADVKSMEKHLKKHMSEKELSKYYERYSLKEDIEKNK